MNDNQANPAALGHLIVLEVVDDIGELCGKMFADMGATVTRIEPPGGAPSRSIGPFLDDKEHPERSLHFWSYNTNKRGVTLDLDAPEGQALFKRMAERADIVIESMTPSYMDDRGLSFDDLHQLNPRLVYVSLSAYGRSGPRANFPGGDLAGWASSGFMYTTGWTWQPPMRPWGRQASHAACLYAMSGALAAILNRRRSGKGQHVDVSLQEAAASTGEGYVPFYVGDNMISGRRDNDHINSSGFKVLLCKDGWVHFNVGWRRDKNAIVEWMTDEGVESDLTDKKWLDPKYRRANFDHVVEIVSEWTKNKTKTEIFEQGQERGLECAPVYTIPEVYDDPQLAHRGYWVDVEHPELERSFTYSGAPYLLSETPWSMRRRAPLIGEDNDSIYGDELELDDDELANLTQKRII